MSLCVRRLARPAFSLGRVALATPIRPLVRALSTTTPLRKIEQPPSRCITINGAVHPTDDTFNVPPNIASKIPRRLHLQHDHPIAITRQIIEGCFPAPTYRHLNSIDPVVTVAQNFDSLGTPPDHVSRSPSDTYYLSARQLLRTHTSAHQADAFREGTSPGYTIAADVYRRDEIDRSHYPIFHQMEGARSWSRADGDVTAQVLSDLEKLPTHDVVVDDPNPPFHAARNPLQAQHAPSEAEAVAAHLKRSLELMIVDIFSRAAAAAGETRPLQMRWVEAYFPFTSPSWELEVLYGGDWLEVLGCGVVQHALHADAGRPDQLGWAFGLGLDRIAMLLFDIPDIRLFWSTDVRFSNQFSGVSDDPTRLRRFAPFSKYPGIQKDMSFWLPREGAALHDNDVADVVRTVAGDAVEDVRLFDTFAHPKTGLHSRAYRMHYRSLERTLTHGQANDMHDQVKKLLVDRFGVEIRD